MLLFTSQNPWPASKPIDKKPFLFSNLYLQKGMGIGSKDCARPDLHELHLGGCVSPGVYSHVCLLDVSQLDPSFPPKTQHRAVTEPLFRYQNQIMLQRGEKICSNKKILKVLSFKSCILSQSWVGSAHADQIQCADPLTENVEVQRPNKQWKECRGFTLCCWGEGREQLYFKKSLRKQTAIGYICTLFLFINFFL